jgi:hypothetical protein
VATPADAAKAAGLIRARGDAEGLLVLRDDEDGCPREDGPDVASWFRDAGLPFPVAVTLFDREYETIFLPCLDLFAGRPLVADGIERRGIAADTLAVTGPEARRDAKGLLSAAMPPGRSYKPTLDQLPLTRMLDFERLRAVRLPCFETLERALRFLLAGQAAPGQVFPLDR